MYEHGLSYEKNNKVCLYKCAHMTTTGFKMPSKGPIAHIVGMYHSIYETRNILHNLTSYKVM